MNYRRGRDPVKGRTHSRVSESWWEKSRFWNPKQREVKECSEKNGQIISPKRGVHCAVNRKEEKQGTWPVQGGGKRGAGGKGRGGSAYLKKAAEKGFKKPHAYSKKKGGFPSWKKREGGGV